MNKKSEYYIESGSMKNRYRKYGVLDNFTRLIKLHNIKIGIKLNLAMALIIITCLSIIIYVSLGMIGNSLEKQAQTSTINVMKQGSYSIKMLLGEVDKVASAISRDKNLSKVIDKINKTEDELEIARLISSAKSDVGGLYQNRDDTLQEIVLASKNGHSITAGDSTMTSINKPYIETVAYKEFIESKKNDLWIDNYMTDISYSKSKGERTVSIMKNMYTPTSLLKGVGTLQINIKESVFYKLFQEMEVPNEGNFYVVGSHGNMIFNPQKPEENGLLISELNKTDKEGRTLAELLGKTKLKAEDEGLNSVLYKVDTGISLSEDVKENLKLRDNYLSDDLLKDINIMIEEIYTKDNKSTSFGSVIENYKINNDKNLVTFYTIKELYNIPLGWTFVSITPMDNITKDVNNAAKQIVIIGIICLMFGSLVSVLITRDISSGIGKLIFSMKEIKDGNLHVDCDLHRKDEIGSLGLSFNDMVKNLKKLMVSVKEASDVSIESSQTVSATCEESYASMEQFSAMLMEVKNEIDNQTKEIDGNNKIVNNLSQQIQLITKDFETVTTFVQGAKNMSQEGKSTTDTLKVNAEQLKETIKEFGRLTMILKTDSGEISKITNTIKSISKQTNLLALNATIEASRAGEAGKSFGVVASEIKKLANMSKESANYIEKRLKDIGKTIDMTDGAVKSSEDAISVHDNVVGDTIKRFDNIVDFMNSVFLQITNITESLHCIEEMRENIIVSMGNLFMSTKRNISDVNGITEAMNEQIDLIRHLLTLSENLGTLSDKLEKTINIIKV